jgi:anti-anti-sigma factor
MLTPVSPREPDTGTAPRWRCGIRVQQVHDRATVYPHGELDVATAPRLNMALSELRRDGVRDLTVDLADVTFLDTAGLRVLLEHAGLLRARRGRLHLTHPSNAIRRLLHVTRTAHLLAHDDHDVTDASHMDASHMDAVDTVAGTDAGRPAA